MYLVCKLVKTFNSNAKSTELKKHFVSSSGSRIDEMTLKLFSEARNIYVPVSGTMIREKARAAAESLGASTSIFMYVQ